MIDSFHIYLNGTHAMVRRQSGLGWRKKIESVGEFEWNANDPSTLAIDTPTRCSKWLRRWSTMSFYVGSACCKFMAMDLPPEVKDEHELRAIAAAQVQYQLGLSVSDWCITLDITQPPGKSVACAIRRDLIDQIKQLVAKKKFRLISCQAYISSIWNEFEEQSNDNQPLALFALESDALTVVTAQGNNITLINTFLHGRSTTLIERELKRLRVALNTEAGQHIYIAQSVKPSDNVFLHGVIGVQPRVSTSLQLQANFSDLLILPNAESAS